MMDNKEHSSLLKKDEERSTGEGSDNVEPNSGSFKWNARNIFTKYLDRCSTTGVSFIRGSENKYVRTVWSLLLFLAICGMALHLGLLIESFFEYNTYSKVDYTYSRLKFPAVTICNANPIRLSKVKMGSEEIQEIISFVQPENLYRGDLLPSFNIENRDSNTEEEIGSMNALFLNAIIELENMTLDENDLKFDFNDPSKELKKRAALQAITDKFKVLFAEVDEGRRQEMGHQLDNMILMCYFNGENCDKRHFRTTSNLVYGNCHTLEHDGYISSQSGLNKGLTMILRLEMDEYIHTVSEGFGAQLVIHERNTIAFPDEDGIALSAGSSTMIGIRQVEISRLSKPYGECSSVEDFRKKYGINPTRNTCYKVCEYSRIMKMCNCYDNTRQDIGRLLHTTREHLPCTTSNQLLCIQSVLEDFNTNLSSCNCDNPCSEVKFEKTISQRPWPSLGFSNLLVQSVCLQSLNECHKLKNKSNEDLKQEFLMVKIYFEDLNYEVYHQTEDYEITQFFSDIGGTIGLWIGLSLLGLCEVLHLVIELMLYICRRV